MVTDDLRTWIHVIKVKQRAGRALIDLRTDESEDFLRSSPKFGSLNAAACCLVGRQRYARLAHGTNFKRPSLRII
jgi:hypothetical protein